MDQDSFRQLLTTPRPGSSSALTPAGQSTKKAVLDPSQPAFKPRKVKKKAAESDYRDRASERRAGVNDYAQVEAVLDDFEERTADIEKREVVEEQRRYLGGDKDHTILVKGLDFALLEQNKARAAELHEDDDSLEAAFQEAQSVPVVPKKRTREDIIRELKENRATGGTEAPSLQPVIDDALEKAKKVGKFKPIGAPDEPKEKEKSKKSKEKEKEPTREGERKKKRRKVVHGSADANGKRPGGPDRPHGSMLPPPEPSQFAVPKAAEPSQSGGSDVLRDPIPELNSLMEIDADVDIFVDAGEYEGVDLGDDDDEEQQEEAASPAAKEAVVSGPSESYGHAPVKSWFKDDTGPTPQVGPSTARSPSPPPANPAPADEEPESEQVVRLAPLASSALPSISDFLAMDAQAEAQKKRKAKKEKKKGAEKKVKVSTEVKVDRDYKKLNSYMAKKDGGSGGT